MTSLNSGCEGVGLVGDGGVCRVVVGVVMCA